MDDAEVLVVGAGPTGLALACDLRQRGVDAQVIEQREGPSTTSRAFALQPRGLEILEDVGAGSISRRTAVIGGVTAHAGGQPLVRLRLDRLAHSGHPGVYFVSQADVEAELRDRLRHLGGEVAFAHELVAARHEDGRVVATVRHEQRDIETRAAWLAGCDGAHSTVREHAGITFEGESFPETFLLADLELERPGQHREVSAFIHGDGPTAFFPLPDDNTFRFIAQIGDDVVVPDDPGEVIRLCKDLLEHRAGYREPGISGCLWSSRFQIHRRLAARYRSGRMLLAGDAAHVHSPFGGQGMNVGLGDASNLGWKLAQVLRGSAGERLLDSYEGERRPVARQIVGLTTSATRTVTSGQRAALTFRNRVLPMLARTGKNGGAVELAGPRLFVERFAQLRVSYRGGPLVAPRSPRDRLAAAVRPGPEPGDRAPDGAVTRRSSQERTHLRAVTRGGWAVLLFGPPSPSHDDRVRVATRHLGEDVTVARIVSTRSLTAPERWPDVAGRHGAASEILLEDHEGVVAASYRPHGDESMVVRPDGHLGWRSSRSSQDLDAWLRRVLGGHRLIELAP